MIKSLLHTLAARPAIYNLIQKFAGVDQVYARIAAQLLPIQPTTLLFDVGGGTGLSYQLLKLASARYVCLDIDPVKVIGFHQKFPAGLAAQCDALHLPIPAASVDVIIMVAVSHHLTDGVFEKAIQEIMRVLKSDGKFIFVDAVWASTNLAGRFIWSVDRGSFPRTQEKLYKILGDYGRHRYTESFRILHRYVLCVVTPLLSKVNDVNTPTTAKIDI